MLLDDDQLFELTKRKRHAAQAAVLKSMGITHIIRADGSVVVSEAHVQQILGCEVFKPKVKSVEPNWEAAR